MLEDQAVCDGDPYARLANIRLVQQSRQDNAEDGLERPVFQSRWIVLVRRRASDLAPRDAQLRNRGAQDG